MKSIDIINNRKNLDNKIKNFWNIIRSENVVDKNYKRNYDMKAVLSNINELCDQRVQNKLDSICINLGFKSRKELPKDCLYPIIYKLSEKNEIYVQLGLVRTIDPKIKTKVGNKNLLKTEKLTREYINNLRNKLQLEINGLKKKLEDFNNNAELDTDSVYEALTA